MVAMFLASNILIGNTTHMVDKDKVEQRDKVLYLIAIISISCTD